MRSKILLFAASLAAAATVALAISGTSSADVDGSAHDGTLHSIETQIVKVGTRVDVSYPYLQIKLADPVDEACGGSTTSTYWVKAGNSSSGARITSDQANMLMSLASSAMLTKRPVNIAFIPGDCVRSEPRLIAITVIDE